MNLDVLNLPDFEDDKQEGAEESTTAKKKRKRNRKKNKNKAGADQESNGLESGRKFDPSGMVDLDTKYLGDGLGAGKNTGYMSHR